MCITGNSYRMFVINWKAYYVSLLAWNAFECLYIVGNSTDTLELTDDSMEYEMPDPQMMSEIWCLTRKCHFLADRTNGRTYATVLRLSVVCRLSSVTLCIVAKRCVLEQNLLLRAYKKSYEKSIGTKMNDLDLCLEVISRSCQLLRYNWRWISRKPLEIEAWFQRTTNRKWHVGYRMVTWPMTSRDLERSNSWPEYT